jgi:hypothetical protein
VAKLGAEVMPFDIKSTTHIFTKASDVGTQWVVAKDSSDAQQIQRVREHLRDLQEPFQKGRARLPQLANVRCRADNLTGSLTALGRLLPVVPS